MKRNGLSPLNRSLTRGILVLRAFRPGTEMLGNGELAERTGLARASISRLTQTLTEAGYLEYSKPQRAYRLGAAVLTLGHAMRSGSPVLRVAIPRMTALARRLRINVGLAVRDQDEMVYLESVRFNSKGSQRSVVSGQRVPIELTALGRAWLAAAAREERDAFMAQLRQRRRARWRVLKAEIDEAAQSVERRGYCVASWQPQVLALAAPITPEHHALHVLNVSVTTDEPRSAVIRALEGPLLMLASEIRSALNASVL